MSAESLSWADAVAGLRELEGRLVAVRIARPHHHEELIAVVHGRLGALSERAKQPSLFWPIGEPAAAHLEVPGLYLRERDFQRASQRAGGILVIEQADVVVNVRPLEAGG